MGIEVSEIVKKDIEAKVASLNAQIEQNNRDIAEHLAAIDLLTDRNVALQELVDGYTGEVVENISVKVKPIIEVEPPVIEE